MAQRLRLGVFGNSELYYFGYQLPRHGLGVRKLDGSFRRFVGRQLVFEYLYGFCARVKPDVMLHRGEVHKVAVEREGGHSVADSLLCFGSGALYRFSEFLQNCLRGRRKFRNILIYRAWYAA